MVLDEVSRKKIALDRLFFDKLIGMSQCFFREEQYRAAVVCAKIAAEYASFRHPGVFVSPELEEILIGIGRKSLLISSRPKEKDAYPVGPKRILHVLTYARPVGGDTRFVWRWIQKDIGRTHSVLITGQQNDSVPKILVDAVAQSGGTLHTIDPKVKDPLQWAQTLRDVATCADMVALHLYPEDILPLLAFANKNGLPPIVYVALADERFWLGASIGDVFVHLRESGLRLAQDRSGIERERISILPIPLLPKKNTIAPVDAKRQLGIPEDSVLLLSIARGMKYVPVSNANFIQAIRPVLEKHHNARILVIGPENEGLWKVADQETGGKIRALGVISDTALYYEAADIYIDSFPFSSNTSLLEAGSFGLPLVSYFSHSPESDVLGAGAPGLDSVLIKVNSVEHYSHVISHLITDVEYRKNLGESTKRSILEAHDGWKWDQCLKDLYAKAFSVPQNSSVHKLMQKSEGELDALVNRLYPHLNFHGMVDSNVANLSFLLRFRILKQLIKIDKTISFEMFFPGWFSSRFGRYFKGWRRFPLFSRLLKN